MSGIYLSTYCVGFRDYEWLRLFVRDFSDFTVGVEFATGYRMPEFEERLRSQIGRFWGRPVTLHAPFIEWCTVPGSAEEEQAHREFLKTCRLYEAFCASSVVFHTHEGSFAEEEKEAKRLRAAEVLCTMAKELEKRSMCATVENVGDPAHQNVLFSEEQFLALFDSLPQQMGCLLDIGHALLNGWDIVRVIHTLKNRIRGYHLHNNDGIKDLHLPLYDPRGCAAPEQIDEILAAIAAVTPAADLILEYAPGNQVTRRGLEADLRRIRSIVKGTWF